MLGCAYGHSTPSAHGPWEPNISSGCDKSVTILHSNRGGLKVIFGCEFKRNPLSSLNERCPWKSWAKTSLSQPGTEKEDVKRDAIFGVTDCCRKNRTRQCGFFRCFWNNNEMSHISKEMRGKSEGGRKRGERVRGGGVFTGDSAVRQRNHPLIREDSHIQLIRGRSGELKVSEVRQYNSRSIQKLFAAKTEFLFFFLLPLPPSFPPLSYLWSLSLSVSSFRSFSFSTSYSFSLVPLRDLPLVTSSVAWTICSRMQNSVLFSAVEEKHFTQSKEIWKCISSTRSKRCRLFSDGEKKIGSLEQHWISHVHKSMMMATEDVAEWRRENKTFVIHLKKWDSGRYKHSAQIDVGNWRTLPLARSVCFIFSSNHYK